MITSSKQRSIGVILQYLQMGLNIIIQLVYTPLMLRILGANEYGIYNLASSTISYLSLLSLGFGASYIRFYSLFKKDNDKLNISKMNGLYLSVFVVFATVALIAGSFLTANIQWFYNDSYSASDIAIARVLMIFLTINISFSFIASVFNSYITCHEKFIILKLVSIGKTIISPIVNIFLLYCGFGSIGMVISTTVISALIDIFIAWYCIAKLRMRIVFGRPNLFLLKDIFAFTFFIAINQIIDQINWQTDKVILGKFTNGTIVAVYSVGAYLNTMFTQFSTAISNVFAPKVNMIISRNESDMDDKLTELFIRIGRIQWFILMLILSGFVFFGQYFVYRWAGTEYSNSYWVALLLMCPAMIPLIQNIGLEIQRAKNKHQFRSIVYLFMAILNVGISLYLVTVWKEIGVAIGTTISLIVANGLIMNIYYQKKLGINVIAFWKSIGKTLIAFVLPCAFGFGVMVLYSFHSLFDFSLFVIAYTMLYGVSVYFLGFNEEEKSVLRSWLAKILGKFKILKNGGKA